MQGEATGIFGCAPRGNSSHRYRSTVELGRCKIEKVGVDVILTQMARRVGINTGSNDDGDGDGDGDGGGAGADEQGREGAGGGDGGGGDVEGGGRCG
eukprot:COSAG06_NODE_4368_length_4327_cov_2.873463_6_plen_97_part_00